jgi:hypothetical protein
MRIAWQLFDKSPTGWARVQAICDYVHRHVVFGYEHARPTKTAFEVLHERTGVCREVPVGHVTNGVHVPTWDSAETDDLWIEACGKERWRGTVEPLKRDMRQVSDARLWQLRSEASKSLVDYARQRLSRQLAASGAPAEAVKGAKYLSREGAHGPPGGGLYNTARVIPLQAGPAVPLEDAHILWQR